MSNLFSPSYCFFGKSGVYLGMLKMKLNKEEQEFIAENITKFDVVTGITVNEIEVRVHGEHFGGVGSSAMYRTNDIRAIYAHTHAKCVAAEKAVNEIRNRDTLESDSAGEHSKNEGSKGTRVLTYEESMER